MVGVISTTPQKAQEIGSKHGKHGKTTQAVVFEVDTAAMTAKGFTFQQISTFWHTSQVPATFLTVVTPSTPSPLTPQTPTL